MRILLRPCVSIIVSRSHASWFLLRSLDCVVIQQKKQRPSGFWKLEDNENDTPQYAIPTTSLSAVKEIQTTTAAFDVLKVPAVRTTLPNEDIKERQDAIPRSSENIKPRSDASATVEKRQLPSKSTQTKQSRQDTHDILTSLLKARKFHLVKNPLCTPSPFSVPKTIAQKHRNKRKKDLAIFAERLEITNKAKNAGDVSIHNSGETREVDHGNKEDISQLEQPRKRPNATAAERKWRTENWAITPKPDEENKGTAESINEPSSQWNYGSTRLAEQLQAVALEEIRASEQGAKRLSLGGRLKVKPKPPKPRQPRTEDLPVDGRENDVMTDAINLSDDGDYVLDTYVRSSAQPFEVSGLSAPRHDSLHGIDHGKIGILVIEDEEEEALWEAFAEDQDSDLEWNSEEEDENGLWTDFRALRLTDATNSGRLLWK